VKGGNPFRCRSNYAAQSGTVEKGEERKWG
jgi:hypothetical protein